MSKTIGGNPLRAAAIRQGRISDELRNHPPPLVNGNPNRIKTRPYTEEDRKMLLAPISIGAFGGKSWGGMSHTKHDHIRPGQTGDGRYGWTGDWPDLNNLS